MNWLEIAKPWFWKSGMYDVKGMAEEIARLRAALERIAAPAPASEVPDPLSEDEADMWMRLANKRKNVARDTLRIAPAYDCIAKAYSTETTHIATTCIHEPPSDEL